MSHRVRLAAMMKMLRDDVFASPSSPSEKSSKLVRCLPDEILEGIFMQMETPKDLHASALVCRRWSQLSNPILYRVVVLEHENDAILFSETVCTHHPELSKYTQSLRIKHQHVACILIARLLRCRWPRLKVLSVRKYTEEWWKDAGGFPILKQLEHFELSGHKFPAFGDKAFANLHSLRIRLYTQVTAGSAFPALPNLRKLVLDNVVLHDTKLPGLLPAIPPACPHLEELEFRSNAMGILSRTRAPPKLHIFLSRLSKQLKIFTYSGAALNLDADLMTAIEGLSILEELTLEAEGDFDGPFALPATLETFCLQASSVDADRLTDFLSGLVSGKTLPMLASIPSLKFRNVTGEPETIARYKKEAKRAWWTMKDRDIHWVPSKGELSARSFLYGRTIWQELVE